MTNQISDIILTIWKSGRKVKRLPSGWWSGNAVCCHHTGSTIDTRGRGGLLLTTNGGVAWHCFNCQFKASYQAGHHITRKMRQLLSWMGASDEAINKLVLEALKIETDVKAIEAITIPTFENKSLPTDSIKLSEFTVNDLTIPAIEYIYSRGLTLNDYDFYVSPSLADRVIIPFYYDNRLVGFTARKLTPGRPKYYSEQTPGYVFNLDNQQWDNKFVIVVEGPLDAISVGGVAILGADIMEKQALIINNLQKQVIYVPDRDKTAKHTINQAIDLGWGISMPPWSEEIKDANDAIQKYGKLYTISSIITHVETYELKIRLREKKWLKI